MKGSAAHGWPGGIGTRFSGEGWSARTIDGHNHDAIEDAFRDREPQRPHCVVAVVEPKEA